MLDASLLSGWNALFAAYASVQVPMVAGLVRGRGGWRKFLTSPVVAASLTALVGGTMSAASPLLSAIGVSPGGLAEFALGVSLYATSGYAGGRVWAQDSPRDNAHQRGAMVAEHPENRAADRTPSRGRSAAITLAGRDVPAQDETKHFKLIGTTGTGKSTRY